MRRVLIILGALGGVFVTGWVVVTWLLFQAEVERTNQLKKVVALGDGAAASLNTASIYDQPLVEACKGKLAPGAKRSLVVYALPLPKEERPSLDGKRVEGQLVAWSNTYVGIEPADPLPPPREFLEMMGRYGEFYEWPRYLEQKDNRRAETAALRFVAVALFSDLSPAAIPFLAKDEKTFDPGSARYRVRVLTFPGGETVCEGIGKGRMVEKVIGHGKARDSWDAQRAAKSNLEAKLRDKWIEATLGSPFEDLCAVGGEELCFSARLMTDGPDW